MFYTTNIRAQWTIQVKRCTSTVYMGEYVSVYSDMQLKQLFSLQMAILPVYTCALIKPVLHDVRACKGILV